MRTAPEFRIRPTSGDDATWIAAFITECWGAEFVVSHGVMYHPHRLPGFVAESGPKIAGLATYSIQHRACELVTINAVVEGEGVGTALLQAVVSAANDAGCTRAWLMTTNDNLSALAFYQKRGFHIAALHVGAVAAARRLKPSLPLVAPNGIPIRDELELHLDLARSRVPLEQFRDA